MHKARIAGFFIVATLFFLVFRSISFAEENYVLPYPSFMPGSKFYVISEAIDAISKYWYFGDIGSFKYNLSQSDKYLVQAKTLFEYNQYLLGKEALDKSDKHFLLTKKAIRKQKFKKNFSEKEKIFTSASNKHIQVLTSISSTIPSEFKWTPEKKEATFLNLSQEISESINIRKR